VRFRHDLVHEIVQPLWQERKHDAETVKDLGQQPFSIWSEIVVEVPMNERLP
jgi:hypothetical protein